MKRSSASTRLGFFLGLVCLNVVLAAKTLGLFPDVPAIRRQERAAFCEAVAANCSILASRNDYRAIDENLRFLKQRNAHLLSAGVRRRDGHLQAEVGNHGQTWIVTNESDGEDQGTDECFVVPILAGSATWGRVELRFESLSRAGWLGYLDSDFAAFLGFVTSLCALIFILFLRRALTHLNPAKVVPERVRTAFDTLAEGLVLLDSEERIVLANKAFAADLGTSPEQLLGHRVGDLPWQSPSGGPTLDEYPWRQTTQQQRSQSGRTVALDGSHHTRKVFIVNSAPIVDDRGGYRGALVSLDNVTELEQKKAELLKLLDSLRQSRDEIQRQNEQLKYLSTRDPLTSCLNRRTFFEHFATLWTSASRYGHGLCCMMVDIDHFKSINDTYGHAVGDEVLRALAQALSRAVRETDIVCRYGGEEFCILLPHVELNEAAQAAERFRQAVAAVPFPQLHVTASFGVASVKQGAATPQQLIEQADQCLYVAKRRGRNQVVRLDDVREDELGSGAILSQVSELDQSSVGHSIPYQAVAALISTLSYRDADTAAHAARVADLAALQARRRLPVGDAYVVEIAGLLHDIGKIGVPDSILLKAGKLTPEEWDVMAQHDRFGVEIVNSCFNCEALTEIVRTHHARFEGDPERPDLPRGNDIPLGARIVMIADAYDAMVSDRVYRKGMPMQDAFKELRRCAGGQFDPELVQEFIEIVQSRDQSRQPWSADVSQQTTLDIGIQVERLANALQDQDLAGVASLAQRLTATAEKYDLPQIAKAALNVAAKATDDHQLQSLVQATHDLLDVCRQTHASLIRRIGERPASPAKAAPSSSRR